MVDPLYAVSQVAQMGLLNPQLYARIKAVWPTVRVVKSGERFVETTSISPATGFPVGVIIQHGEQYRLNCPYCSDTTKRLYVNHMFGQMDFQGRQRLGLIKCYNEDCLKDPLNRDNFTDKVLGFVNANSRFVPQLVEPSNDWSVAKTPARMAAPIMPDDLIPLTAMYKANPSHPALEYMLNDRRYSLEMLQKYNISYCGNATNFKGVSNRIVFPCYRQGNLWGWQGRLIGPYVKGGRPKYYNLPNMDKISWLYNFDTAMTQDMLVLTEGIPAAHFLGDRAAALLGKTMSPQQRRLISGNFAGKWVVVWLDHEEETQAKAEVICKTLRGDGLSVVNVKPVDAMDPADYGTDGSWHIIMDAIRKAS